MKDTKRQLNLDLLRIVAMFMIVTLHILSKGKLLDAYPLLSAKYNLTWILESISFVGVNCFVLISGYFQVQSKFKVRKLLLLEAEVLFYTFFIYIGLIVTKQVPFALPDLFASIMPTFTGEYWFVSAYIAMYILSPFLNDIIKNMSQKRHRNFIFTLVGLFSIWPIVFFFGDSLGLEGFSLNGGYGVVWFVVLYFIAAYLRLYYKPDYKIKKHMWRYSWIAAISATAILVTSYINTPPSLYLRSLLDGYNSITVLLSSVMLFVLFLNIKIHNNIANRLIAFLSPLTLAVYLIHDEPHVRAILWRSLGLSDHIHEPYFIPFVITTALAIYFSCVLIDWLRMRLFTIIGRTKTFSIVYKAVGAFITRTFAYARTKLS